MACMVLAVAEAEDHHVAGSRPADITLLRERGSPILRGSSTLSNGAAHLAQEDQQRTFAACGTPVQEQRYPQVRRIQRFGSIDIEAIKKEMMETIESVAEIKKYITEQKNIYLATPRGWPIQGQISSGFGMGSPSRHRVRSHHSGLDIRAPAGDTRQRGHRRRHRHLLRMVGRQRPHPSSSNMAMLDSPPPTRTTRKTS